MAAQTMYKFEPSYDAWEQALPDGNARPRVLVADDQADVRYALCLLLKSAGYDTQTAGGPAEILSAIERGGIDLVLMDLNYTRDTTSGGEGLDLIARLRAIDASLPLLAMTAWGSIDLAVEAMRRGAADFVQKPWGTQQLLEKVGGLVELRQRARKARMEQEAEQGEAVEIQRRLVSFEIPQADECEISGVSRSLRFVGGDYCKIDRIGAGRFAISIADVAGKGVPGALLAASLRAAEKPLIDEGLDPSQVCRTLNHAMAEIMPQGKFISFFFGVLDLARKTLVYSNAGHNPPLVIGRDGNARTLTTGGAVLGYFEDWPYEQAEIALEAGDRVVLFTDGIIEAWSAEHGEFGVDKLQQVAAEHRDGSADQIQRAMTFAVSQHCGGAFHDDATLVVIAIP